MFHRRISSFFQLANHVPPCREIQLAAIASCTLFLLAGAASAQNLTADYRFEGTRASSVGSAPALTDLGANEFATETVDGVSRTVLRFEQNDGLVLTPVAGVLPSGRYTIVMLFRFDRVDGFRRTVDFRNGTSDEGAYVHDGRLKHSNDPPNIAPDEFVQVVYTRDGSTVSQRGYVDGELTVDGREDPVFDFALTGTTLRFFRDDNEFPNEASSGAIARLRIYDGPLTESQVALLDRLPADGADLAIAFEGLAPEAGSGSLYVYTARVTNTSPAAPPFGMNANGVEVSMHTPIGTEFALAETTQGSASGPPTGEAGEATISIGTLSPGASALVTVIVNVSAAPGQSLPSSISVSSDDGDTDPSNNEAVASVPVRESGNATVTWEEPPPPGLGDLLPAPRRLVVESTEGSTSRAFGSSPVRGYNVYRSNKPGVVPSPGALLTSIPPGQTSTNAPVAPGGTFFVVTAVYDDGESAPSNEGSAEVPAAAIARVKVTSAKVTLTGTDFTDAVTVFVDGIPFVSPATVKKNNSKVVQKGLLVTGQTLGQYLAAYPAVLISVRNSNGGIATRRFPE